MFTTETDLQKIEMRSFYSRLQCSLADPGRGGGVASLVRPCAFFVKIGPFPQDSEE
jgi:hypothetical protein